MNKCDCYISNKYQLISNESVNHFTLDELMRLVNRLKVNRSFVYTVSNLAELNEIFKYYPTKEQTVEILGGATGIVPVAQNLTDNSIDYAWLDYYTKEEVIAFINAGFIPELPAKTYVFTVNPTPATATVVLNGEVRNTIVVYEGEEVIWQVEDSGFTTQIGVLNVTENTTIDVVLNETETGGGSEEPVPVYTVCIEPTPSDATVLINNELQSCYSGPSGSVVTYTVARTGYVSQNGTIQVNGNKTVQVVLEEKQEEEKYFTLRINPTPSNATVTINGIETNELTVQAYTYAVYEVSMNGYISQKATVGMNEDRTIDVVLEPLPNYIPNYTFTIIPTPSDATVIINGIERRTLECLDGDLVTFEVSKEGYNTDKRMVRINGADVTIEVVLTEKVENLYTLTIEPVPSDATVIINDIETKVYQAQEGTTVTYYVTKEGYIPVKENIIITGDLTLRVVLEEKLIPANVSITTYPDDAIVTINGFTGPKGYYGYVGETIEWSVEKQGYGTKTGTLVITGDINLYIVLQREGCEPEIVTTTDQFKEMGIYDGGEITLCYYDLTQYIGRVYNANTGISLLDSGTVLFEGELTSTTYVSRLFAGLTNLTSIPYLKIKAGTSTYNLEVYELCRDCTSLVNINGLRDLRFNFAGSFGCGDMFKNCTSLEDISPLATWTMVASVGLANRGCRNYSGMFEGCTKLKDLSPLTDWDVFTYQEDSYNYTITLDSMFKNCTSLEDISPVNAWGTKFNDGDGTRMTFIDCDSMFEGCKNLKTVDLSNWDMTRPFSIQYMFKNCTSLTSVKFGGEFIGYVYSPNVTGMFEGIETTGTLYYPAEYADSYANMIAEIPSTWTAVAY